MSRDWGGSVRFCFFFFKKKNNFGDGGTEGPTLRRLSFFINGFPYDSSS